MAVSVQYFIQLYTCCLDVEMLIFKMHLYQLNFSLETANFVEWCVKSSYIHERRFRR